MSRTDRTDADLVELNRRINEEIWNEGRLDLIEELVADDYVEHNPTTPEPIRGPGGYRDNVQRLRAAFPDLEHVQQDVFVADDGLAERVRTRGTLEGEFAGVGAEATGNPIDVESINLLRFEDGRLAEMWIQPNTLGMMQQLGVVPADDDGTDDPGTDAGGGAGGSSDGGSTGGDSTGTHRDADPERNEAILREYVRECWVEGDLDRLPEYVSPDYVEHNPAVPHEIDGIEGHRANLEGFRESFPDMEIEFQAVVAAGDRTAQRMRCRGTHEGEMMGVPPTGKTVEFTASGITRFEDGKMVEDWSQVDMLGVMQQLGVAPAPGDDPE